MKKLPFALLFLQTSLLLAASDKPNPADFPIKIHIISSKSHTEGLYGSSYTTQIVKTIIDGQQIELTAPGDGVLALGDYPARVASSVHGPKNWSAYDIVKGYDFLMPDGKVRTYKITAITSTNP